MNIDLLPGILMLIVAAWLAPSDRRRRLAAQTRDQQAQMRLPIQSDRSARSALVGIALLCGLGGISLIVSAVL